jgi:gamma-glutamylputrescine oxidase
MTKSQTTTSTTTSSGTSNSKVNKQSKPSNIPIWEDESWVGLPTLESDLEADVCVIGLGGSGLSAITELLEHKRSVIGLDAGMVGCGAAGRNGGFLLAGFAPFYHDLIKLIGAETAKALYKLTIEQINRMQMQTPDAVRRVGSLRIALAPEELADCNTHLQALQADGFAAEAYIGPEGEGLLIPTDAAFQPLKRCRILAGKASKRKAQLFEHSSVREIRNLGDTLEVVTANGIVRCAHVIVAVDGKIAQLLPELAGRVRSTRLQMLATEPTREVRILRPVYARWGMEYWQQLEDGSIALGGFRDAGGKSEWTKDSTPSRIVQERLEKFLRSHIGVNAAITHRWAANVSYTDSQLPIAEEIRPRVWALGAYNGTGNVVGALLGRAIAERVARGQSKVLDVYLQAQAAIASG